MTRLHWQVVGSLLDKRGSESLGGAKSASYSIVCRVPSKSVGSLLLMPECLVQKYPLTGSRNSRVQPGPPGGLILDLHAIVFDYLSGLRLRPKMGFASSSGDFVLAEIF